MKRFSALFLVLLTLIVLCLPGAALAYDGAQPVGYLTVHFIDVGQGDATFIELPNGETMMIDAGEAGCGSDTYVKSLGRNYIDYLIVTHPHSDHIGNMAAVVESFGIGSIYMPDVPHDTQTFENLLDEIENSGYPVYAARAGQQLTQFAEILAPISNDYDNLNNYSVVIKVTYGETSFLFMGDAEHEAERDLLSSDIDVDVLRVGHHGSSTSTDEAFLHAVAPNVAVISVGVDNDYGHPHDEVVNRLEDKGIPIYLTSASGTIVASSDGQNVSVDAAPTAKATPSEQTEPSDDAQSSSAGQYVGSVNSDKYHYPSCQHAKKILPSNKIWFSSAEDAKAHGYVACKVCKP